MLPLGPGWGPILTAIHFGESAGLASRGHATAFEDQGGQFFVQSFFDVFFDLTLTDVDPTVNFGGGGTDGLTLSFPDVGPSHLDNFYSATFDPNAPNFGLIPPLESAPYIGFFNLEIPLGGDLNNNGENDKIKFILAALTVDDQNRTFITLPDGTVINQFDATLDLSGGVVDESQDPPFSVALTGPATITSRSVVPDGGSTLVLFGLAGAGLFGLGRRTRRS